MRQVNFTRAGLAVFLFLLGCGLSGTLFFFMGANAAQVEATLSISKLDFVDPDTGEILVSLRYEKSSDRTFLVLKNLTKPDSNVFSFDVTTNSLILCSGTEPCNVGIQKFDPEFPLQVEGSIGAKAFIEY